MTMFDDTLTHNMPLHRRCVSPRTIANGTKMERDHIVRPIIKAVVLRTLLSVCALVFAFANAASAQDAIIKRGDAAVTAFGGVVTREPVPEDVHPLDRTFIDPNGKTLTIFDLSNLGTAPRGQLANAPERFAVHARDIGQVFGVTMDAPKGDVPPNIYVAATSLFGLQIAAPNKDGDFDRLLTGAPGAQWMEGQFGKGGTPGSIYKIDGRSGAVTLFADVRFDDSDNAGPGLGNIAYDPNSEQLFVSDLETGLIHRFALDGTARGVFDHGTQGRTRQGLDAVAYDASRRMDIASPSFDTEDSATWGFADERRRVFGVAVSNARLYYALAEGPAVWSVSIDDDGDFGTDARIELEPSDIPAGTQISDITFDGAGMMYLAQRGMPSGSYDYTAFAAPNNARVLRYRWDEAAGRWAETPEEYAVGLADSYRSTQGGVALGYGYDKNGNIDYGQCRQTMWTTGEHLREGEDVVRVSTGGARIVHGLQGVYKSRVRPENEPPYESWFVDYDGRYEDAQAYGHIGDVAILAPCDYKTRESGAPLVTEKVIGIDPPEDDPGIIIEKHCLEGPAGAKIRCVIEVRNISDEPAEEDFKITDVTRILAGPDAGALVPIADFEVPIPEIMCASAPDGEFACIIPAALLAPGDSIEIVVWVDTHDLVLEGNFGIRNCASLKHPAGNFMACAEGGAGIVVEKFGPGICMPGQPCKFGLSISNAGMMPFDGDVLLADAMFVSGAVSGAPVTSVNPPIACDAGDTNQLPFTCKTHLSLMPGETHIHWVEVTMPAPGGYWAENCFGALDPMLLPPGPLPPGFGAGDGNPSCVWVHVPAISPKKQESREPPQTLIPPPIPRCPDGRILRVGSTCPCAKGRRWNDDLDRCVPVRPHCFDPARRRVDGTCCPRGTTYDSKRDRCVTRDPVCPDRARRRDDGSCCPFGTVTSSRTDRCIPVGQTCPPATRWNATTHTCLPVRPVCKDGERYDWRKRRCEEIRECPEGTRYSRVARRCLPLDTTCAKGSTWNRKLNRCEQDNRDDTPSGGSPRPHCPEGKHRVGRICVPDKVECPPGKHRTRRGCMPDRDDEPQTQPPKVTPPAKACPDGMHRVGKRCVRIKVRQPKPEKKVKPEKPSKKDPPRRTTKPKLDNLPKIIITPKIKIPDFKLPGKGGDRGGGFKVPGAGRKMQLR
ncbi:MAG: hypothetical protein AB7S74_03145 [Hyphomicrobium sp.]